MKIANYQTLVFDCDGVVLNSNKVKTEAFYKAALPYGETAARQLVLHHVAHGGISRYKKFEWFLQEFVPNADELDFKRLLSQYADEVHHGLLTCEIAVGLTELRKKTIHANWLIVSGGDQLELREVFSKRGLDKLFDGGVFGSPDSKDVILNREQANGTIRATSLFLGDSRYDHIAASEANLDFVFLSGWSEFDSWQDYCATNQIRVVESIAHLT